MPEPSIRLRWTDTLLESVGDDIDSYAIAVAFVLVKHMARDGSCNPSIRRLAAMARCSQNVVMDRIARLESAGFLAVTRQHRVRSSYRATLPSASPGEADSSDDDLDLHHPVKQTDSGPTESASPQEADSPISPSDLLHPSTQTASPGEIQPYEPSIPTTRARSTHEPGTKRTDEAKHACRKVNRKLIWTTMAERQLDNLRAMDLPGLPPPGSHRENSYLAKLQAEFEAQHGERVLALRDRLPLGNLERWLYELDPTLSRYGYGPSMALGERYWAEYQAEQSDRQPLTDDDLERIRRRTAETKAQIRAAAFRPPVVKEAS